MDSSLILEFRIWTDASLYEWSRTWTDRLIACGDLSVKLDDSGQGFGGFYPTLGKVAVRNHDHFWERLEKTAPALADGTADSGTEPYRTGFRGRLVRVIEESSGTERKLFTGAIDDVSVVDEGTAELSLVSLQRLAMEQQGDAAKIDDATCSGAWESVPEALYRSRKELGNGGYDVECFRHKRVKALFERTKMPRMDASVIAENVTLSTSDARRTATNVSLPESISWQGFIWGDPDENLAYIVGTATGVTKLYSYDYATGEVTELLVGTGLSANLCEVAWSGLFYSGDAGVSGQVGIPLWDTVTGYPWLKVFDIASGTLDNSIRMDLFTATLPASGTAGAPKLFDEFLMWCPGRKGGTSGHQGTFWILVDSYDYGMIDNKVDNRLVEIDPWDFATWPTIDNDSLNTYADMLRAIWPAACGDKNSMDPTIAAAVPGNIVVYIYGNDYVVFESRGHKSIYKFRLVGGVWQAFNNPGDIVHWREDPSEVLSRWGCLAETDVGLIFCRGGLYGANKGIVSKTFAEFGANDTYHEREPEYYGGYGAYFHVAGNYGPAFTYNYYDDRIYYGTGGQFWASWNTRLRSIDATSNTTVPRDENVNPAGGAIGDPPTDQASSFQFGHSLRVRYRFDLEDWELHGVLVSPLEPNVLMAYSKTFYPCVPLFDVRGKSIWELRKLLSAACYAYFSYDAEGNVRLFARPLVSPTAYWQEGEPSVTGFGMRDVLNRLSAIPYIAGTSEDTREAEVIQQAVGSGSTGVVLNIKAGRVSSTKTFRLTFLTATTYSLDQLIAGVWTSLTITGDRATTYSNADVTLSPDCFAGTFVAGDTFTFLVYVSLPTLVQQREWNKIEVADSASETKWGRTEKTMDNPFVPRAQTIDILTAILVWCSKPHRRFKLNIEAYRYTAELEQRYLTSAGDSYSALMVGWTRKFKESPFKELELIEV